MKINCANCIGCGACKLVCPKKAINIVQDCFGFYKSLIDETKCIDCGLCSRVCPTIVFKKNERPNKCYASWDLDELSRKKSTSGGLATLLAKTIVANGGVAYLCSSKIINNRICHIRISDLETIEECRGSKYVQSFLGESFLQIKQDLLGGRCVFFVGSPCQVSGLKNYLGKDYDGLITVDLVCHGTPSILFLQQHLKNCFQEGNVISFRGVGEYKLRLFKNSKELFSNPAYKDYYYVGFNASISINEECLKCKYSTPERVGDLTLGDFWGLGRIVPFEHSVKNGCSLLVVNNKKGAMFIECIKKNVLLEERDYEEAISGNHNLSKCSRTVLKKELFDQYFLKYGFDKAIKKMCKKTIAKGKVLNFLNKSRFGKRIIKILRRK